MKNIELHKESLEKELKQLETELKSVGRVNPENKADWEGTPGNTENIDDADENSLADKFEEYEERSAVETELEVRLNEVKRAIKKIEEGKFGICKICEKEIEEDRLQANSAAETCKEHINN
jgi:RNA polymerase-binding transcription factor DksA